MMHISTSSLAIAERPRCRVGQFQGHSTSPKSVPIKSLYATSY